MEQMETVYEVEFDRCGTVTTKRATYIPKGSSHSDFTHSEREVMPRERRRLTEASHDRRSRCDDASTSHRVALDLRSSRGRRSSDYVRHTLSVSV